MKEYNQIGEEGREIIGKWKQAKRHIHFMIQSNLDSNKVDRYHQL